MVGGGGGECTELKFCGTFKSWTVHLRYTCQKLPRGNRVHICPKLLQTPDLTNMFNDKNC